MTLDFILKTLGISYLADDIGTAAFTKNKNIKHENTTTTRSVRHIESRLDIELQRLARKIHSEFGGDVATARSQYGALVMAAIQKAVQDAYIEGTAYVERFGKQPLSLTSSDLQQIQNKSQSHSDSFWQAIEKEAKDLFIEPARAMPEMPVLISFLAATVSFQTLNEATMQKSLQLQGDPELVWITELDFKVCPICRPIHGRSWKVGDPLILQPPRDSHPNCRCRLLLKEGSSIYSS